MEVENRWGNTKYLLTHLIPGKQPVYQRITGSKSYYQACQILGFEHLESQANEVDEKIGIIGENEIQSRRGKKNKAATEAERNHSKIRKINIEAQKPWPERAVQIEPDVALAVQTWGCDGL
jgi:tRNA-dihydrouridine synthase 2